MTVRQIFYVKIMGIRSPKSIKKRGGCEIFRRKGDWDIWSFYYLEYKDYT